MNALEQKNVWIYEEDYPSTLNREEILEPMKVVGEFFEKYELQQSKSYLWQWTFYSFTDQVKATPTFRLALYHFGRQLERMVDAAWVISNQINSKTFKHFDIPEKLSVKQWVELDFISFLTLRQTNNLKKVLYLFFQSHSLSRWKQWRFSDLNEALFDSKFSFSSNSCFLQEFIDFRNLSALLECLYLLLCIERPTLWVTTNITRLNWIFDVNNENSYLWAMNYFSNHRLIDAHQSLAFLCHANRFHHEWHPAAGFNLLKDYETIYRLVYVGYELLRQEGLHIAISKKLQSQIMKWPLGKATRFLTNMILESPSFSLGFRSTIEPKKEISQISTLITLVEQQYLTIKD